MFTRAVEAYAGMVAPANARWRGSGLLCHIMSVLSSSAKRCIGYKRNR
jgi:hypothetical protein